MNDAQLFIIFLSVLTFGWLGFLAGKAWEGSEEKTWHAPIIIFFFIGTIGLFVATAGNLISLVERNL